MKAMVLITLAVIAVCDRPQNIWAPNATVAAGGCVSAQTQNDRTEDASLLMGSKQSILSRRTTTWHSIPFRDSDTGTVRLVVDEVVCIELCRIGSVV